MLLRGLSLRQLIRLGLHTQAGKYVAYVTAGYTYDAFTYTYDSDLYDY